MKSFIDYLVESDKHYEKAEEHLSKANDADAKGDKKAFHAHMANHHDAMSEWHDSKGRSASADKHAEKADYHHEKSISESYHDDCHEEVVNELSTELLQRYKDKAMQSSADLSSKGKYKKSTDRLMAHMKATGKQIDKLKKEEVEQIDEAPKDHTIEAHGIKGTKGTPWRKTFKNEDHLNDWAEKNDSVEVHGTRDLEGAKKHVKEGLKPEHKMRPGWMLKADPELAKKVADNKKKYKSFKDTVGKKIETK